VCSGSSFIPAITTVTMLLHAVDYALRSQNNYYTKNLYYTTKSNVSNAVCYSDE